MAKTAKELIATAKLLRDKPVKELTDSELLVILESERDSNYLNPHTSTEALYRLLKKQVK